ncbi:hypothetical protein AGABI1DRAFT_92113 [Agaricus bisporus var. burnettii JB137-S8]|uniref:DUF6535 domain-containing protein n=1 Tax=Agaricus bisporus var. burnettii (strain JB137-S8 / ATCC MYA-4627 / FGSC 10392) TaxID=597362 RepID=K5XWN3_AGABU|nr:uncharacterized protein AGABI1DRAFT_92113 [Agaricus bisporus var. burnettii JB137-S8]EKM79630.1 hypothetical protein AGABI1DRAFT_92113 [Agaricus bisporus var. burnettii JB137-S8]
MPPQAPEKKHFDTTNSDDIKEVFNLFSQRQTHGLGLLAGKIVNGSLEPQVPQTKHFDTASSDDIKESFLLFSQTIKDLDEQLDKFVNGFLRLGHVEGLSSAVKEVRRMLERTREVFFGNAAVLVPELLGLAQKEHKPNAHGSSSKRFYIGADYLESKGGSITALPTVLKTLAASFGLLRVRIEEFPEFTYRASCAKDHIEDRLGTTVIQRYVHQIIYDLEIDFKKLASALNKFAANGIPAIRDEQARIAKTLANNLAAAALFSGVTASTLQLSAALSNKDNTILVVNALWFTSLILSVGAALNCVLYGAFVNLLDAIKPLISSNSESGKHPKWIIWWMEGSHSILLGASILTFSAGLSVFTFSSNQAIYTPYLIIASMVSASAGLGAILIWIIYKILMAKWQTGANSGLFRDGLTAGIKRALPSSPLQKLDCSSSDVENQVPINDERKLSPSREGDLADQLKAGPDEINHSSAALTELILPDEEAVPDKIEFECHGTIRNVEYSDDGKRLAITWSPSGKRLIVGFERKPLCDVWDFAADKVETIDSGYDMQDIAWFDEDAFLVAHSFDVIKMVFFLPMLCNIVLTTFSKDPMGHQTGRYEFQDAIIDSIGIKRNMNYLILITHVVRFQEALEPLDRWRPKRIIMRMQEALKPLDGGRSERRIIIYDMGKQEKIYQVPVLGHIGSIDPVPNTHDILMNQMDRASFQLWSLDPGSKDMLKKRNITSRDSVDPGDYKGFACIGGNHHQYVFNMKESGDIDIWRRESGKPYRTFSSSTLREEGVGCFSWRRSDDETATFATAGVGSHTLLVWRGEERQVPETLNSPKLTMNEKIRTRWQQTVYKAVASSQSASSVPPGAKEVEEGKILKVDPPNGPEAGPSTSKS